jgi:hypothetical protein
LRDRGLDLVWEVRLRLRRLSAVMGRIVIVAVGDGGRHLNCDMRVLISSEAGPLFQTTVTMCEMGHGIGTDTAERLAVSVSVPASSASSSSLI